MSLCHSRFTFSGNSSLIPVALGTTGKVFFGLIQFLLFSICICLKKRMPILSFKRLRCFINHINLAFHPELKSLYIGEVLYTGCFIKWGFQKGAYLVIDGNKDQGLKPRAVHRSLVCFVFNSGWKWERNWEH